MDLCLIIQQCPGLFEIPAIERFCLSRWEFRSDLARTRVRSTALRWPQLQATGGSGSSCESASTRSDTGRHPARRGAYSVLRATAGSQSSGAR